MMDEAAAMREALAKIKQLAKDVMIDKYKAKSAPPTSDTPPAVEEMTEELEPEAALDEALADETEESEDEPSDADLKEIVVMRSGKTDMKPMPEPPKRKRGRPPKVK